LGIKIIRFNEITMKNFYKYTIGSTILMIIFLLLNDIFGMPTMIAAGLVMIIFGLARIEEKLK
jgi:hypothetical protein